MVKNLKLIKDNQIRTLSILFLFLSASSNLYSNSNPYRGGEVFIQIKNNTPCFYINDFGKQGVFSIVIFDLEKDSKKRWSYEGQYENDYPNKDNCIFVDSFNFNNIKLNKPYSVTLGDIKIAYNTDFCFRKNNGNYQIQDFLAAGCVDRKADFWEQIKGWFLSFF